MSFVEEAFATVNIRSRNVGRIIPETTPHSGTALSCLLDQSLCVRPSSASVSPEMLVSCATLVKCGRERVHLRNTHTRLRSANEGNTDMGVP